MGSVWRRKNKNKMTLKHILAGQLLKTTWISNTGFPWNSSSTSFNGRRHQDLISAADQMPHSRKQLTHSSAQLYTVPFAYRASSLCIFSSALFTANQPLVPLEGKRQSWICALCHPAQGDTELACLRVSNLRSLCTDVQQHKHKMESHKTPHG